MSYGVAVVRAGKQADVNCIDALTAGPLATALAGADNAVTSPRLLLVQRKDTMGYVEVIRGRYFITRRYRGNICPVCAESQEALLQTLFSQLTSVERDNLASSSFRDLWANLWYNHQSRFYRHEFETAYRKFQTLDVRRYLAETGAARWDFTEFGLPKGRKTLSEDPVACAVREFCEETGYTRSDFALVEPLREFHEDFIGTNGIWYRHVYYLARMRDDTGSPVIDKANRQQVGEIKRALWLTQEQCRRVLRPYDTEKIKVIDQIFEVAAAPDEPPSSTATATDGPALGSSCCQHDFGPDPDLRARSSPLPEPCHSRG